MFNGLLSGLDKIGGLFSHGAESTLTSPQQRAIASAGLLGDQLMARGAPRLANQPMPTGMGYYSPLLGMQGGMNGMGGLLGMYNPMLSGNMSSYGLLSMLNGGGANLAPLLKGSLLGAYMPQNWETTVTPAGSHPNAT